MKAIVQKVARIAGVVIHDPQVQRQGKQFAVLIAVRLLLAAGASAQLVELIQRLT